MERARFPLVAHALAVFGLAACGGTDKEAAGISGAPVINTIAADRIATPIKSNAWQRPRPVSRLELDPALQLSGSDGVEVDSSRISIANQFGISAEVRLGQEPSVAAGTIVSKGEYFALFASSPSRECFGYVGALVNGVDLCTKKQLNVHETYLVYMSWDGREIQIVVSGEQVLKVNISGPLDQSTRNIIVGRRASRSNPAGLIGALDDVTVEVTNQESPDKFSTKRLYSNFNDSTLSDYGFKVRAGAIGNPTIGTDR